MTRGRPGYWRTYLALSKKCEKLQPFSNVVMKTAAVLCHADSPQFTLSSPLLKNVSQLPTPWGRSLDIYYERFSLLFTPTLHVVYAKHPKKKQG